MKKLRVTVENKVFEVLVEILDETGTPFPAPAPVRPAVVPIIAPIAPAPTAPAAAPGDVLSPLAGKVVSIDIQAGQSVAVGAQVATIEAMKMNTYVYASAAGTVSVVHVKPGDAVEEGTPLVKIG